MKVYELIEKLKECNQQATVMLYIHGNIVDNDPEGIDTLLSEVEPIRNGGMVELSGKY